MLRGFSSPTRWVNSAPSTSTSTGNKGDMFVDSVGGWLYICYATNLWQRASISPF